MTCTPTCHGNKYSKTEWNKNNLTQTGMVAMEAQITGSRVSRPWRQRTPRLIETRECCRESVYLSSACRFWLKLNDVPHISRLCELARLGLIPDTFEQWRNFWVGTDGTLYYG